MLLEDIFSQFFFIISEVTLFWLEPKYIFLGKLAISVVQTTLIKIDNAIWVKFDD